MLENRNSSENVARKWDQSLGINEFKQITGLDFPEFETFSPVKKNELFDENGWLLSTKIAKTHNTKPHFYLRSPEGKARISWLQGSTGIDQLVRTQSRATWLHPYLAYWFVQHLGVSRRTKPVLRRINEELTKLRREQHPKKMVEKRQPTNHNILPPVSLTEAAKKIGIERQKFIDWLRDNDYIEKRSFTNQVDTHELWFAKQWTIDEGILVISIGNRRGMDYQQTKVTPRGIWHIFEKITAPA